MDAARFRLRFYLAVFVFVMFFGTIAFSTAENLSMTDAAYFTIVTVATVGYGDIHPATGTGKAIAIFLIITGTGTFLGVVANITELMLNRRERQVRAEKLNIVTGIFFSEVGLYLLKIFAGTDLYPERLHSELIVTEKWNERRFSEAVQRLASHKYLVDIKRIRLEELRDFLIGKRWFMISMLENPAMMEHEAFTELVWAIFHFSDELTARENVADLPDSDHVHLAGDIRRVYSLLTLRWISHMQHLEVSYPYLFSLAMRTNPFDRNASPVVSDI